MVSEILAAISTFMVYNAQVEDNGACQGKIALLITVSTYASPKVIK